MRKRLTWIDQKKDNLIIARRYIQIHAPYFAPTLYSMVPTPVEKMRELYGGSPLAVTERLVLLYDPKWVEEEKWEVVATGIAHEILHDQLHHLKRGKLYPDKLRFNKAGDLVINQSLRDQKESGKLIWEVPDWFLVPETYGFPLGLTADQYYQLLAQVKDQAAPSFGCGKCGGIAGHEISDIETYYNKQEGRSEEDVQHARESTLQQIKEYGKSGTMRGTLPGVFKDLIEFREEPAIVDWGEILQNKVGSAINNIKIGGMDYSMRRPSRRSYLRGFPIPGLIAHEIKVLIFIDSSGSMGKEQLKRAIIETAHVLTQTGINEVWLCFVDASVQNEPRKITVDDLREITIPGRGGTDFRPAFKAAQEMDPKPHVILYYTDGDGVAPNEPPEDIETIWCLVPSTYRKKPAPWGELIVISQNQEDWRKYEASEANSGQIRG